MLNSEFAIQSLCLAGLKRLKNILSFLESTKARQSLMFLSNIPNILIWWNSDFLSKIFYDQILWNKFNEQLTIARLPQNLDFPRKNILSFLNNRMIENSENCNTKFWYWIPQKRFIFLSVNVEIIFWRCIYKYRLKLWSSFEWILSSFGCIS